MSWTPTSVLAQAVYAAGFLYDPDQDIIYSRMDALQRNFGYAFGYDAAALAMNAVIDCEPIFFDYDGKHWMIELWKGQYGLETGSEIGVYTRPIGSTGAGYALLDATVGVRPGDGVPSHNLFYDCASDADRLELSATLSRNGTVLFTRGPEMHWWLTGFKWGVLSDPAQLSVDVAITLKDDAMRDAFLAGISGRPYPNLQINGTTVSFTFVEPFAQPQPPRPGPVLAAVEAANEEIVSSYDALGFPNNDPNDVQAEFLGVAGLGILHLGDHYGLIAAQLATELGQDIGSVVSALVDGFGVAASTAEGWLNGVAPEFASWVSAVEQYFGLPLDFSCYVAVDNTQGSSDLLLAGSSATSGSYVISPPAWIPKGAVGRFVIQDPKPSISGSGGSATYSYADADLVMRAVEFTFTCPTGFASNEADASRPEWSLLAKSGDVNDPWSATVPGGGHPLYLTYAIVGGHAKTFAVERRPFGYLTDFADEGPIARLVYRDASGHIWELNYPGTSWGANDLTAITGGQPAADEPSAFLADDTLEGPTARVVYRGTDGHIWQLAYSSGQRGGWGAMDLTARAGGQPATGAPFGYLTNFANQGPCARLVYRDASGHIWELNYPGTSWGANDLTAITGGQPAADEPSAFLADDTLEGPTARVVYRGTDGHIWQLAYSSGQRGGWGAMDLTARAGGQPATGAPFGYLTNFANQGPCARVVYPDASGHIWELNSLVPGRWGANDLTARAGGQPATGALFGYLTNFANQGPCARVVYPDASGHIWELNYPGTSLGANDLTHIVGGGNDLLS